MLHKHKCSNGHTWEHGQTSIEGLTEEEWNRANKAAHTCGVCGEVQFNRWHDDAQMEKEIFQAAMAGKHTAAKLFERMLELSPNMEPAELLSTVYYFASTAIEAYKQWEKARAGKWLSLGEKKAFDPAEFWKNTFGETVPNPFTEEGVKQQ